MEEKKMTIGDIAQTLGVSKTTVSRAMSGKGRIGEETRKKVLDYIAEHNYSPNVIAKGLAQSKTYNIGMVLPGDYNVAELPFFQKCMLGISREASARGYDVLISMVTKEDISQLERAVADRKIDGVILTRTLTEDASIRCLKENDVPFVAIGSTADDEVVQIDNDHLRACRELTGKILEQGVRKLALIGGDGNLTVTADRLRGFQEAVADNRKKEKGAGKAEAEGAGKAGTEGAGKASEKALGEAEAPVWLNVEDSRTVEEIVGQLADGSVECIVSMDDYLCGLVLNALQRRQIAVPEQMKAASFYDSTLLESRMIPVTSIRFDVEELGKKACGLLMRILDGEEVERRTLLGYELCMRRSTQ